MPTHKKELEQRGSITMVAILTARGRTSDPRTASAITFRTDQGQPEALVERQPTKEKQASIKEAARHGGCGGGQRHAQGHEEAGAAAQ